MIPPRFHPLTIRDVRRETPDAVSIAFDIPPVIRFAGEPGEQRTMFFFDPSGNPIEVKGFRDLGGVFAH